MVIFSAERHIYEPCDEYSHCEKKSVCQLSGHTRLCQCISDYEDIDGRCVKGKLHYEWQPKKI